MGTDTVVHSGLEGVVAARTRISLVDGEAGRLIIGGFPLEEIAPHASFEEVVYLLWHGVLPNADQLSRLRTGLIARRALSTLTLDVIGAGAARGVHPMDVLRMGADTLSIVAASADPGGAPEEDALTLVAAFPTIVAAYARALEGKEPVAPRDDLGHAANYLHMLFGQEQAPEKVRACETYLITVCDHGLNASTFTARVIMSTRADMISAIVGAVGALKGPLHGGAPGPALDMVFKIETPARAEPYLRDALSRGERLMGFGHRVYKVRDPRADVLSRAADQMFQGAGRRDLYDLAKEVERVALRLLAEHKPGRRLQTNVEYYTALVLHGLGLATALFTPTFAIGRVAGWTAHCFEQMKESRIIRPQSVYEGEIHPKWIPMAQRHAG